MIEDTGRLPLISVVIPTYNGAAYIEATIRSVFAQTLSDFEIIVIDDCSKDLTVEIVERLKAEDDRVRLIRLDRNRGAPAAPRNIGVEAAVGEWVALLDADDIWHKEKLEIQHKTLLETGTEFCSSSMVNFTDEQQLALDATGPIDIETIGFWKQLINSRTPTSSVVARRSLLLRHPFNEDPRYRAREDFDCWLRCYEEIGSAVKVLKPLVGYRIIEGQISGSKWEMLKRHLHVLRRYRRRSGRALGAGALAFTLSHFLLAVYHRRVRKGM